MPASLFDRDRRSALTFAGARPARQAGSFADNFAAGFDSIVRTDTDARNRYDFVQTYLDAFEAATGEALPNPEAELTPEATARGYVRVRRRYADLQAAQPDAGLAFPEPGAIDQHSVTVERSRQRQAASVADASPGFVTGTARALGMMAGAMADPVNLGSVAFGATRAAGVLRTMMVEAGVGMGSQAVVEAGTFRFNRRVDPDYGLGDAAANIAAAGAGGAILGGGVKGIAALWSRLKASPWSRVARDAGHVVERDAVVATPPDPPADRGPQAETAHRAAVEKATEDLFAERPVQLPPESVARTESRLNRVFDADGRAVDVRYEVIDAGRLTTSHLDDFAENPAFPPDLQPRDRDRAQAQTQVAEMASRLEPDRLGISPSADSGAPIVGPDGFVESGNGRVMALRRAYATDGEAAARYRDFLRRQGFDTAGMDQPVMIARRVSRLEQDQRIAFVTAANRSSSLRLSAAEQALADARLLDGATLDRLKPGDVGTAANRDFVRAFASRLAPGERGDLFDAEGALSKPGQQRLTAALMGRAYGETAFLGRALEDADSNIRTVAGAMADSAGSWARLRDAAARGDIPRGMDVTADLLEAVRTIMRARDTREPVMALANQAEMFGGPSEVSKLLLRAMFSDENLKRQASRQKIANVLDDYAAEAMKNEAGPRLFGEPLAPDAVLATALRRSDRADLFTVAAERTTQEAAEKIAADPATMDAVILEADRLRALRSEPDIDQLIAEASVLKIKGVERISDETFREKFPTGDPRSVAVNSGDRIFLTPAFDAMSASDQVRVLTHEIGHFVHMNDMWKELEPPIVMHKLEPGRHDDLIARKERAAAARKEMRAGSKVFRASHWATKNKAIRRYLNDNAELAADAYALWRLDPEAARKAMPTVSAAFDRVLRGPGGAFGPPPTVGERIMVPVEQVGPDGTVTVTERSLDDLFDEADAEIDAARDIEACATGKQADQE